MSVKLPPEVKELLDGLALGGGQDRGEFVCRLIRWFERQSPSVRMLVLGMWQSEEDAALFDKIVEESIEAVATRRSKERSGKGRGQAEAG